MVWLLLIDTSCQSRITDLTLWRSLTLQETHFYPQIFCNCWNFGKLMPIVTELPSSSFYDKLGRISHLEDAFYFFLFISQNSQARCCVNARPSSIRINQEQPLRHGVRFLITLHIPQNVVSSMPNESKLKEYLKYNYSLKNIIVWFYFELIYVMRATNNQALVNHCNIIEIHWIA